MPSTVPKQRRHLPRSRELDCPVCGQAHPAFSCLLPPEFVNGGITGQELVDCMNQLNRLADRLAVIAKRVEDRDKTEALSLQLENAAKAIRKFLL
jgi:hypothetical protein